MFRLVYILGFEGRLCGVGFGVVIKFLSFVFILTLCSARYGFSRGLVA